jgi:hypothetical protein
VKKYLLGIWHSFPVQLIFLHFRKYQLLLLFWFFLASAVSGGLMNSFGADSLFLAPEYMGDVNFLSAFFVGLAYGGFIMSWNIATFILFSNYFKFLATSSKPFLKYCLNNGGVPLLFLINYFIQLFRFDAIKELMNTGEILLIAAGFLTGLILFIGFSFLYFYGTERAILKTLQPVLNNPKQFREKYNPQQITGTREPVIKVQYFLTGFFSFRKTRNVSHYSQQFLDTIFKRHHFAAVTSILIAFLLLMVYGLFLDNRQLQLPAAASIFVFFSILIGASGALAYWLSTWSVPVALVLIFIFNLLFRYEYIDIRNKAFGLNYENRTARPEYSLKAMLALCTADQIKKDSMNMIQVLNNWKKKQTDSLPYLYVINVSGGGNRSATYTVNVLMQMDSIMNGKLFEKTFFYSGASGGMLGATYFRELYRQKLKNPSINLQNPEYAKNISKDLLNPVFSAYITRDIVSPAQKFSVGPYKFVKDRGYSFEQQFNYNTGNILDNRLTDYQHDEWNANIPMGIFSSTISQDGRKMMICTQPISFLMRPQYDSARGITAEPDAIDFCAYFKNLDPYNVRMLTALRMNATFPYVLPNVWMPTKPIVDVMDAGLRDNYGQEITLRFLHVFQQWINENTAGVVYIQIRDRKKGEWNEDVKEPGIGDILYKPVTTLQYNFYKVQDYMQETMLSYSKNDVPVHRIMFIYTPVARKKNAALSFHLTAREKEDIAMAVYNEANTASFKKIDSIQKLQGINKR